MVLLIYCYVCLCALFISSFDLMWRAAKSLRIIPEQDDKLTHLGVYCSCVEAILGSRSSGHLSASCRTRMLFQSVRKNASVFKPTLKLFG